MTLGCTSCFGFKRSYGISETQVYTLPYPVLHERWVRTRIFVLVPRCSTEYSLGFFVAVGFLGCRRARAGSPENPRDGG